MPIDLEAVYDNRASVPEYPGIAERWGRASAAYRARAHAGFDLAYVALASATGAISTTLGTA